MEQPRAATARSGTRRPAAAGRAGALPRAAAVRRPRAAPAQPGAGPGTRSAPATPPGPAAPPRPRRTRGRGRPRCSATSAAARRSAHSRATLLRELPLPRRPPAVPVGHRRHGRRPSAPVAAAGSGASPSSSGGRPSRRRARPPRPASGRASPSPSRRRLQLEGVEPVRRLRRPLARPRLDGIGGRVQQDRQARALVGRELREHVVDRAAPRLADPHPQPAELLGPQLLDDRAQPVVPAVRCRPPGTAACRTAARSRPRRPARRRAARARGPAACARRRRSRS